MKKRDKGRSKSKSSNKAKRVARALRKTKPKLALESLFALSMIDGADLTYPDSQPWIDFT